MQVLLYKIFTYYKRMNRISRYYIKYGNIVVFTLFFLALFCTVSAGRFGNFDYLIFTRNELLICAKEMLGAIYVPALIIEIVSLAEKIQFQHNN